MDKTIQIVLVIVISVLGLICLAMTGTLLYGFFNDSVNNDQIFEILGPAFSTIIGAFVGLLGGISLESSRRM